MLQVVQGMRAAVVAGFVALASPALVSAEVIDTMDDLSHFSGLFGSASLVFGGGIVELSESDGGVSSGVLWGGAGGAPISLATSQVTITPSAWPEGVYYLIGDLDGSFEFISSYDAYSVAAVYFDADGYLSESLVLSETSSAAPVQFDVASGAPLDATHYQLKIYVQPDTNTNGLFAFDAITAVPEPGTLALAGAGMLLVTLRRRRVSTL